MVPELKWGERGGKEKDGAAWRESKDTDGEGPEKLALRLPRQEKEGKGEEQMSFGGSMQKEAVGRSGGWEAEK